MKLSDGDLYHGAWCEICRDDDGERRDMSRELLEAREALRWIAALAWVVSLGGELREVTFPSPDDAHQLRQILCAAGYEPKEGNK